ncbi:MAG: mechanosensitive ion channel [Tissierellia bacterium]|nr:mechanosensitive ion channel [Tissierellia bacterium]
MNQKQYEDIIKKIDNLENNVKTTGFDWMNLLQKGLIALVIFIVGTQIIRIIRHLVKKSLQRKDATRSQCYFADMAIKILLYIILIITIAGTLGIQTTSFVALIGSMGIGIGLALQGSLSDLAAGILIMALRPFQTDDIIYLDSTDGERLQVEEIRFFNTRFLNLTNYKVIIPNSTLVKSKIINVSKSNFVRFEIKFAVDYDTNIDEVRSIIFQLFDQEEKINQDLPYQVSVTQLADSGIDIVCRAYVESEDHLSMKLKMLEKIKKELDAHQVEFPFPQLVIQERQKTED